MNQENYILINNLIKLILQPPDKQIKYNKFYVHSISANKITSPMTEEYNLQNIINLAIIDFIIKKYSINTITYYLEKQNMHLYINTDTFSYHFGAEYWFFFTLLYFITKTIQDQENIQKNNKVTNAIAIITSFFLIDKLHIKINYDHLIKSINEIQVYLYEKKEKYALTYQIISKSIYYANNIINQNEKTQIIKSIINNKILTNTDDSYISID